MNIIQNSSHVHRPENFVYLALAVFWLIVLVAQLTSVVRAAELQPVLQPQVELSADGSGKFTSSGNDDGGNPKIRNIPLLSRIELIDSSRLQSILGELAGNNIAGKASALRALSGIWEVPTSVVFDCVTVGEFGLGCYTVNGGPDVLKRLDRPAVIELGESDESTAIYGLIHYIVNGMVVLILGEAEYQISLADIQQHWNGTALLFWRRPPLASVPVSDKSSREDILWLRRALSYESNHFGGLRFSEVERDQFDGELLDILHEFQRRNTLPVRDLVGENELIILNTRLGYTSVPKLVY